MRKCTPHIKFSMFVVVIISYYMLNPQKAHSVVTTHFWKKRGEYQLLTSIHNNKDTVNSQYSQIPHLWIRLLPKIYL